METEIRCTFKGFSEWYAHAFEKFGWMILAKHSNKHESIQCYVEMLLRFNNNLEANIGSFTTEDKIRDLRIIQSHIQFLYKMAIKLMEYQWNFQVEEVYDVKPGKHHEVTFCVLSKWYKSLFEKLGWALLLCDLYNDDMKLKNLEVHLNKFIMCIRYNLGTFSSQDKIRDLQLMHDNALILLRKVRLHMLKDTHTNMMTRAMSPNMSRKSLSPSMYKSSIPLSQRSSSMSMKSMLPSLF